MIMKAIKIVGLFIVVFGGLFASKAMGFSEPSMLVGAIVGGGSYILSVN